MYILDWLIETMIQNLKRTLWKVLTLRICFLNTKNLARSLKNKLKDFSFFFFNKKILLTIIIGVRKKNNRFIYPKKKPVVKTETVWRDRERVGDVCLPIHLMAVSNDAVNALIYLMLIVLSSACWRNVMFTYATQGSPIYCLHIRQLSQHDDEENPKTFSHTINEL